MIELSREERAVRGRRAAEILDDEVFQSALVDVQALAMEEFKADITKYAVCHGVLQAAERLSGALRAIAADGEIAVSRPGRP